MSTDKIYSDFILEDLIHQILDEGKTLTVTELTKRYNAHVKDKDLKLPQFNLTNAKVTALENASATKWNRTNTEIHKDLQVAYLSLLETTKNSLNVFDRWRSEINLLEIRLRNLNTRIDNLIGSQTDLNTYFLFDDFVDTMKVDLANTTALVDIKQQTVSLNNTTNKSTKLSLNTLKEEDIQFTVLSRSNLHSISTAPYGELLNAFLDTDGFWQGRVRTNDASLPVTAEVKVKLASTPISINKITVKLHSANTTSAVQITPLYSTDNINYKQLPTSNVTVNIRENALWNFSAIDAQYIKFIITKSGYDFIEDKVYIYEFGVEEIAFYSEVFTKDSSSELVSKIQSILDIDKNPIEFNKVSLEACERIPANTSIDYYISALHAPTDTVKWQSISDANDFKPLHPKTIAFGDTTEITVSNVSVSFNPTGTAGAINPSKSYSIITVPNTSAVVTAATASGQRYAIVNSNDRILNHEIAPSVTLVDNSIEVFRNVGAKHTTTLVRTIQRGWGFTEPHYYCVVEVTNQAGLTVDFGDQEIIIDGQSKKGKITLTTGIHTIRVHKNNWVDVAANATSLNNSGDSTSLATLDPLYPFNHKYLIEGYTLSDINNPYTGVDIFAEFYLTQVSVPDFIYNITKTDYSKFAVDVSVKDISATVGSITSTSGPNTVFMVKSNENYVDFLDELFTIRFDVKNKLYKYLKFKAKLSTTDAAVSPNLDGYKIKLSR